MLSKEERKAFERIEDFLTTNIIISISNDDKANSEELKAFISKNEYLAIEFIATMFLKQSKEIEEYKKQLDLDYVDMHFVPIERYNQLEKEIEELKDESKEYQIGFAQGCYEKDLDWKDKIKAKIEEYKKQQKEEPDAYLCIKVLQSLLEKE